MYVLVSCRVEGMGEWGKVERVWTWGFVLYICGFMMPLETRDLGVVSANLVVCFAACSNLPTLNLPRTLHWTSRLRFLSGGCRVSRARSC